MDIYNSILMKYLSSVDSYYDPDTGLIYRCKKSNRDLKEGKTFVELNEKWWDLLSIEDSARLDTRHGLY
jgi:hypothetical protein